MTRPLATTRLLLSLVLGLLHAPTPTVAYQLGQAALSKPSYYPPVLKARSREGFLPENAPIGTTVRISPVMTSESLQIVVEDQDLKPGMMPAIYQYVINGFGAEKFAVDERGFLYLNADGIDADSNSSTFQLQIQAREVNTEPTRSSEPITITIHVLDVNDNSPVFAEPVYVVNVSADSVMERFVAKVEASDLDSGKFGRLVYRIVEVSDGAQAQFKYDPSTHVLTVSGRLAPNHRYRVTLEAEDGGGLTGRTTVLVYAFPSAQLYSDFSQRNTQLYPARHSSISPLYQSLTSLASSYSAQPLLPLTTIPLPTTTTQQAVSNQVQTIVTELNEATPPNSIVAVLGDEQTVQHVYFSIIEGNEAGKFAIDPTTGAVTTSSEFDREENDLYTLQIEARSRNPEQSLYWTLLQVAITDANDNSPEFSGSVPYSFAINLADFPNMPPNIYVGAVKATDLDKDENGRIRYRILSPMDHLFKIDHAGRITINGSLTSDHFGNHTVIVVASDHGDPPMETSAEVRIHVNGQLYASTPPPLDTEQMLFTRATLPPMMTSTHSDLGHAKKVHTKPEPLLPIVRTTLLSTTTTATPRRSETKLTTMATPASLPSTAKPAEEPTTETQNLRTAPVFAAASLSVMVEENDSDLELATLEAHYPDDQPGPITYILIEGDSDLFAISSHTGKLTLLRPLDAESDQEYQVVVSTKEAQDLPLDSMLVHATKVHIKVVDVNDWIPNFETNNYAFTISDNTEPGTVIGQVTAFDQDRDSPNNKIHYKIVKTNKDKGYLSVNAENGLVTLSKSVKDLKGKKISVVVQAQDEGEVPQATQTTVVLSVERAETEIIPQSGGTPRPQPGSIQFSQRNYTTSLLESVRAPHFVMLLPVMNKPKDTRFLMCAIVSGNYRQAFSISPGPDGNCELRTQSALDRETIERYLLNVTVTVGLATDAALVSVTVLDVNDNAPKFVFAADQSERAYFAGVSTNAPAFSRVAVVRAEDPDLGQAGLVQYQLDQNTTDAKFFQVDRESGEVSLKQSMAQVTQHNKRNSFELRLLACDSNQSGQKLCGSAQLYVTAVSDQHRFGMTLHDTQPKQDIIKALRQFTGSCTLVTLESMEETSKNGLTTVELTMYAQNPTTHNVCRKQEFRKLFTKTAHELLAGKVRPWFHLERIRDDVQTEKKTAPTFMGHLIEQVDWSNATMICAVLAVVVIFFGFIASCAVCLYWKRKKHRHRHVHTYPNVYPLPKYNSAMFMCGTVDRDKIYETQMPMSDEDFATMKHSSLHSEPRLSQAHYGHMPGARNPASLYSRGQVANSGRYQHDGDFSVEESMYAVHPPNGHHQPKPRPPNHQFPGNEYQSSMSACHKKSLL